LAAKAFSLRPATFFIDLKLPINTVHLNIYVEEQRRFEKQGFQNQSLKIFIGPVDSFADSISSE
jgi:hypothetical protein